VILKGRLEIFLANIFCFLIIFFVGASVSAESLNRQPIVLKALGVTSTNRDISPILLFYSDLELEKSYTEHELLSLSSILQKRLRASGSFELPIVKVVTKDAEAMVLISAKEAFPLTFYPALGLRNADGKGSHYGIRWLNPIGLVGSWKGVGVPKGWMTFNVGYNRYDDRLLAQGAYGIRQGNIYTGVNIGFRQSQIGSYEVMGMTLQYNDLDDLYYPRVGSVISVSGSYAAIGFTKWDVDWIEYWNLTDHISISNQVIFGHLSGDLDPFERYEVLGERNVVRAEFNTRIRLIDSFLEGFWGHTMVYGIVDFKRVSSSFGETGFTPIYGIGSDFGEISTGLVLKLYFQFRNQLPEWGVAFGR